MSQAPRKTTVDISHTVLPLVVTAAFGVAPAPGSCWSSASSSMSGVGKTLDRAVQPLPAVRVSPKPESV